MCVCVCAGRSGAWPKFASAAAAVAAFVYFLHIQNFSQFFIFLFFPCFMRCLHRTHTLAHTESETVRRRHAWGLLIALFRRLSAPNPQQQRHSSFYPPPPVPSLLSCPAWHYAYDACNLIHAFIYLFMRCLSMN